MQIVMILVCSMVRHSMWFQLVLWIFTFLRVKTSSWFDVVYDSTLLRVNNKSRN